MPANSAPSLTAHDAQIRDLMAESDPSTSEDLFGISQLCQEFNVTPRTLRFYEDKGLLSPRRVNSTRIYTKRDKGRLALILRSKAIGATLEEIKHYLDLYGQHGEGKSRQLEWVIERTDDVIAQMEAKQAAIAQTLDELRIVNAQARARLTQSGGQD
jgi:DNA-binding transcriptional MerR regulator